MAFEFRNPFTPLLKETDDEEEEEIPKCKRDKDS